MRKNGELKVGVRGMAEFGQQHYDWMRKMQERGIDIFAPDFPMPPIEMTQEEFDTLSATHGLYKSLKSPKFNSVFGHPITISAEPVNTIPLLGRA